MSCSGPGRWPRGARARYNSLETSTSRALGERLTQLHCFLSDVTLFSVAVPVSRLQKSPRWGEFDLWPETAFGTRHREGSPHRPTAFRKARRPVEGEPHVRKQPRVSSSQTVTADVTKVPGNHVGTSERLPKSHGMKKKKFRAITHLNETTFLVLSFSNYIMCRLDFLPVAFFKQNFICKQK